MLPEDGILNDATSPPAAPVRAGYRIDAVPRPDGRGLNLMTKIIYLHGFASSPLSSKAQFFRRRFAESGVTIEIPRLDEGNFEALTITGQLGVIDRAVAGSAAILMGSSLGGYLAALYAARHPEIERLVLLAPGFQFPRRFRQFYSTPIFHYGYQREMKLGYQIVEDAANYEDEPAFLQPALVIHGTLDSVVPAAISMDYAAVHPNVTLHLIESGHELTDVLDPMWDRVREFLGVC
jgi:pimeloyl-ACP methyl ester carboxylesterase